MYVCLSLSLYLYIYIYITLLRNGQLIAKTGDLGAKLGGKGETRDPTAEAFGKYIYIYICLSISLSLSIYTYNNYYYYYYYCC